MTTITAWEHRQTGTSANSGGGFSWKGLVNSTYKWTASGSGTNEFYVELSGGGDPGLTEAKSCHLDGSHNLATNGMLGSLNASEWDWGDNDTLGYSTVYVRLLDGLDPDSKHTDHVGIGGGGGQDYSQQGAAQLVLTDLATSGIGVKTITSVTGGFTALMVDNVIQIRTGTNVAAGFYLVDGFVDSNTITVAVAPDDGVGGISGGSGDLGGGLPVLVDAFFDGATVLVVAGDVLYIKSDGTMTFTSSLSTTLSGTSSSLITIDGYDTVRGDDPTGANRPTIAAGANTFSLFRFYLTKNLIITTTASFGYMLRSSAQLINCKITNSSVSANRVAYKPDDQRHTLISCELVSDNGICISLQNDNIALFNCYLHDSVTGINFLSRSENVIVGCTFDTLATAIKSTNSLWCHLWGNTFYNCTTVVDVTGTATEWSFGNNILDNNTDGVKWNASINSFLAFTNCWDNTTDVTNVDKGADAVNGDPGLTDPANGDFTLGSGSNCLDAGTQSGADIGLVGDYKVNIGVDQDDVAAGGGTVIVVED